jgi:hypothetical protein
MAHTIGKREVDRYYDDDLRHLVIVTEVDWCQWNRPERVFTKRVERRILLTTGEAEYLRQTAKGV